MDIKAKKSLGQNFLHSAAALARIMAAAAVSPGETILEIGPGTGILTRALLDAGGRVIAVEKDSRAIPFLQERFAGEIAAGKLDLSQGDILDASKMTSPFAVVANIPYYITGAFLRSFLETSPRPSRLIILVQKEVAERIVARDGRQSLLSISVKSFGEPRLAGIVPRGAFRPVPGVDSAILAIENVSDRRFRKAGIPSEAFFRLVRAGFAHKRKILRRNLEAVASPSEIETAWRRLGLAEDVRAEELGVESWFSLATLML